MKLYEIQMTMERIRDARHEWAVKHREVNTVAARSMKRLLHEAIAQRMSVEDVSKHSGYTKPRIRQMMRNMGMEPKWSKTMLAKTAAEALHSNAELLGIDPVDMDLLSPLAYLPAGSQLQTAVRSEATRGVTEVPEVEEEPVHTLLYDMVACNYYESVDLPEVVRLANGGVVTCDDCKAALAKARS